MHTEFFLFVFFFASRIGPVGIKFCLLEAIYNQNLVLMFHIFKKQNFFVLLSENMNIFRH